MGHIYGLRFSYDSEETVHQLLVSLPSFFARSSEYGYRTDGFEAKNADAYIFVAAKNRVGDQPHPDLEVVIEPYGLYINCFSSLVELEESLERQFGALQLIL